MIQRNDTPAARNAAHLDLTRGLDAARGLDLYSGAEPALDDIVVSGDAIEAMLEGTGRGSKLVVDED